MAPANELSSSPQPAGAPAATAATFATVDAQFSRRMDLWGAYHRMAVASLTMAVTFGILPQPDWLLWLAAFYLALSALVPTLLQLAGSDSARAWVRVLVMLVDVLAVSLFVYRWGARSSPATFMYVPIVSGWTLIPQRGLGRLTVLTVLLAYGALLVGEQFGWSRHGPDMGASLAGSLSSGALIYFVTLGCAIAAVHGLVDFTVMRLREHGEVISRLTAEMHTRDRESQLVMQLEEAQRLEALGRLAGGVAHDFNNLLTVLMGCAELAEMNLERNPTLALRSLQDLQSAAERGASLTAQLLDFASRRPASPRHVDLNALVTSSAALLQRLLDASVELRVTKSREPCVVHLDPSGMERLLLNLAVNARDAMPTGGILSLTLSTRKVSDDEQVVLEVSDTGVGIPSTDLPHIFEPFFTTKARGKGTGLGLASVYGLVKQSQGHIEVESRLHAGTTFRIAWPRASARASVAVPRSMVPTRGSELILLVDDDLEVRSIVQSQLEGAGYAVLAACSGDEALQLLEQNRADVRMLVSDVSMPGMSGIELARRAHELCPALPILLISGFSEELHGGAQRIGRFLAKPFSGQQLLAEVRQALDG
ncbi:MAG: domain S-box protein [Myxococcaceae bacterium]|nr:domain S-box protein [Myxococcaceae bacterium]